MIGGQILLRKAFRNFSVAVFKNTGCSSNTHVFSSHYPHDE